jgi:hypothetical protein
MSYVILPSRSLRQPAGRLVVRPEIAAIAEAVIDCRSQAHAAELTTGRAVTRGSAGGTTEQSVYGYRNRFPGNSTNSYWAVPITAIGTGEFTVLFGDVRYNAYAVDSLQGYCCDFNAQAGGAPTLTHSANTTALGWYDGGSHYTVGIAGPGGNVNSVAWRRATSTNYITAALGSTIGTTTVYHPANITGTTWNVGGFKALGNGALHPNFSLGYALLLRRWADDEFLRDVAENPYGAVFRADPARRIFIGPAAGGATAYAIDAQPGGYSVSGTAATLARGLVINAAPATYAVSGTAASVVRGYNLNAATGTFAATGVAAGLLRALSVNAGPGTFSLAGTAAGLDKTTAGAYTIDAQPGTYSLTGTAATLVYTPINAYTLDAQPGAYTFTGMAAGLTYAGSSIWTDVGVSAATWSDVGGASSIWTDL